jgi:actin-like ATPase involved in cell morphogenesis
MSLFDHLALHSPDLAIDLGTADTVVRRYKEASGASVLADRIDRSARA